MNPPPASPDRPDAVILYRIEHTTAYEYGQAVTVSHHLAHLRPRMGSRQTLRDFHLQILPSPALVEMDTDYFGNSVDRFSIQEAHDRLEVTAVSEVEIEVEDQRDTDDAAGLPWEIVREQVASDRSPDCLGAFEFAFPSGVIPVGADFAEYAAPFFPAGRPILEGTMDLTEQIHRDFAFDAAATTVSTPVSEVFKQKRGVCQDFAHLQIACLRSLGLPARYVSGYVRTDPPPGLPRLIGVDATHAWVSVFSPDMGWVEFDPTNRCRVGANHVHVAFGRDYQDVSPLRGTVISSGWQRLSIAVTVTPFGESASSP